MEAQNIEITETTKCRSKTCPLTWSCGRHDLVDEDAIEVPFNEKEGCEHYITIFEDGKA